MAGSVLTRDWEALEMTDMIGQHGQITVTGEVELAETGTTAELKEHAPQGINPKILLLDLVIHRQGGIHGHIAWFEKLSFKKRSSGDAYDEVDILHGGEILQRVKVEHPLTFAPPPAPAAKKALAKKPGKAAAGKKKAPEKAAKKAKKPARKAVKKSAAKVAKRKPAKKSPSKRKSGKKRK